jgi:uncharacterized protein YbjT (DUF2867 family)
MVDRDGPVLVIGATGQQGSAVTRELLARGRPVHALVRDPEKPAAQRLRAAGARLVRGDLDDHDSLRAALSEVTGMFLVLTMMTGPRVTMAGIAAEERRGTAVAELAKETGIRHLVYSSVSGAQAHTGVPHLESKGVIERHIAGLDLPATVLRPAFFMDNFATHTRPVVAGGELVVNLALRPETRLQLISTRDIGALAAIAFGAPDAFIGRRLVIAGDARTGPEIAEEFGRATGVQARFRRVPLEEVRAFDEEVARMFGWLDTGDVERADLDALRALHPGLMTLGAWLSDTGWKP